MYLPVISAKGKKVRRQTVAFGGLDRTREAGDGSLADSRGLSFDQYPCLSVRRGHVPLRTVEEGSAIFAWGKLCTVEGTTFFYDGAPVGTVQPGKKQFAVVNTKLCIFPDKKYLDLTTREFGDLGASVTNRQGLEVRCTADSLTLEAEPIEGETPFFTRNSRPKMNAWEHRWDEGTYYYAKFYDAVSWDQDTGTWTKSGERELWLMDSAVLNQKGKYVILQEADYAGARYMNFRKIREVRSASGGNNVEDTYETLFDYGPDSQSGLYGIVTDVKVKNQDQLYYGEKYVKDVTITLEIHNAGVGNRGFEGRFFPGDRVFVSGCTLVENNTLPDRPLTVAGVSAHTLTFVVPKGESGVLAPWVENGPVTVERRIPDLDVVCQSDNRLFGANSAQGLIYASALGDPRNFYVHDGQSTDSWRQSVGTAGDFTGCVACGGSVLFWKEDYLHKIVYSRSGGYQLYTQRLDGVQKGSGASMAVINDTLYYKGRDGVYAYAGSKSRLVSAALGAVRYDSACATGCGELYRLCMRRQDTGAWEMLSYHTGKGAWLKEGEEFQAVGFARLDGVPYLLTRDALYAMDQAGEDQKVTWEATFNPFTEETLAHKYPSRLLLRLELEPGAWVEAELARDGGVFQSVWSGHDPGAATAVIPVRPDGCHSYQLRLKGQGRCVVQSMARDFTLGRTP